ncbi:MAG: hypothetical protein U0354_09505 [Candidatus Sericytochromatia bacterium]
MPPLTIVFIRTALIYLVIGFGIGALILINKAILFEPRLWQILPLHIQIVLFGWIIQLVFGVAFWIMPRLENNLYGKVYLAWFSYITLNTGLFLSGISYFLRFIGLNIFLPYLFILSLILIFISIISFAKYIFPRVRKIIIPNLTR